MILQKNAVYAICFKPAQHFMIKIITAATDCHCIGIITKVVL
jgi:hypothetical protein